MSLRIFALQELLPDEMDIDMKKLVWCFTLILTTFYLLGCSSRVHHDDPFYNDPGEFAYSRIPLIKPYYVDRMDGISPWEMSGVTRLWAPPPNDWYSYWNIHDVRKLSVENGVIMVYSPYIDEQTDQSIRENYFHWFVIIPDKNITEGFDKEETFLDYIQQYGILQIDWLEPKDVYKEFRQTGCLDWIPDCN